MASSTLKRKRRAEENESSDGDAPVEKSVKYWFEDGNVVLQAENTRFRVHRSMLAHHSNVFKDTFNMPQPHEPLSEPDASIEGCPLVVLIGDKAMDVEYMMSIFYDNFKNNEIRGPMAFDHLAAILRLGKKYEIDHFCAEGLRRIRAEFPSSYEDWKLRINPDKVPEIAVCENYLEKVINLAHELSIESILPSAYLLYVIRNRSKDIFSASISQENRNALPPHVVELCLGGRDILESVGFAYSMGFWTTVLASKGCATPAKCWSNDSRTLALSTLFPSGKGYLSVLMMDQNVATEFTNLICDKCKSVYERSREDKAAAIWSNLPQVFLSQTWDELKDFDT